LNSMWDNFLDAEGLVGSFTDKLSQWKRASFIRRYFNTLDPIQTSHYTIANPITFAGDFEIEVDFSTTSTATQYLVANNAAPPLSNWIGIHSSNYLVIRVVNQDYNILSTPDLQDGKLHQLKVVRLGTELTTTLDGVEIARVPVNSNSAYWAKIGERGTGLNYFDGIIANVKFTDLTNATTTTFALDTPVGDIEYSEENVFGSELSEVSLYTVTAGLSQIIDDTTLRILTDSGGALTAVTAFGSSDANSYILTFTATNSGGALNITDGNGAVTYFSSAASGDFEVVIPPNGLRFKRGFGGVLNDILVTNISIREISNAVQYIGIPDINEATPAREEFTLVDGDWLGSELIVNGDFATDSDWTKSAQVTISGGNLNLISNDGSFQSASQVLGSAETGNIYQATTTTSGYVSGQAKLSWSGDASPTGNQNIPTGIGTYEVSWPHNGNASSAFTIGRVSGVTDVSIDNVSVKRILEVAP
jgi:hypothetical protein